MMFILTTTYFETYYLTMPEALCAEKKITCYILKVYPLKTASISTGLLANASPFTITAHKDPVVGNE